MKYAQRLDDARLAEVLNERGMADLDAIREMLQAAQAGGAPFAESLVNSGLIGDWDLSRVVAEIFQLPFLPVDMVKPNLGLWEELNSDFFGQHGLVPISRFGQVLTVSMPGLVPADVLGMLAAESDLLILPVVGTVETNRRWLLEQGHGPVDEAKPKKSATDWSAMFDEADAAVQMDLGDEDLEDFEIPEDLAAEIKATVDSELADLGALEFTEEDDDDYDPPSLVDSDEGGSSSKSKKSTIELPPMPEF